MQIQYKTIVLRDMIASDIEDYVRWFTTETQWSRTDAPWEPLASDAGTERAAWRRQYEAVQRLAPEARRHRFEIQWEGRHIGWVNAYPVDEQYRYLPRAGAGQTVHCAVGICICESGVWGQGIGANALRAFMDYCFENGEPELYTQTWSGHVRMLRCAEKLGFVECARAVGTREVEGKKYDALTLRAKR